MDLPQWLWTQSPVAYTSDSTVRNFINRNYPKAKRKTILKKWSVFTSEKNTTLNLHRPIRKSKLVKRRWTEVPPIPHHQWQGDLIDLASQSYPKQNKGCRYILVFIDCMTRNAFAQGLRSKNGPETAKLMEMVFKQVAVPKLLQVDQGKEFYNTHVKKVLEQFRVNMFSTFSQFKAGMVERFNRTLKRRLQQMREENRTLVWYDQLSTIVSQYNNTYHRSIGMTPNEALKEPIRAWWFNYEMRKGSRREKVNFKIGDLVRVSKLKGVFEKGYTNNWTHEIFKIQHVLRGHDYYQLVDMLEEPIKGSFHARELQKVGKLPETFPIEKVLKKKGGKYLVRWKGWPAKFDSWVDKIE